MLGRMLHRKADTELRALSSGTRLAWQGFPQQTSGGQKGVPSPADLGLRQPWPRRKETGFLWRRANHQPGSCTWGMRKMPSARVRVILCRSYNN